MQVDGDGDIVRTRVARSIPASDSPLIDALNVLLQGPTPEEQAQGLMSFIPPTSRLLSAEVRGSTAYLNLSEDFLFGTMGSEGYASQLVQMVWTATEFSNVRDVQILIEGRRKDYLGESVRIGSPISRESTL
jgi:spore germination protein GerM